MYSLPREWLFPNRWPLSYINVTTCMPFRIVLSQCASEIHDCMHYGHNPKPFCDDLEQFQHFVKIMKSDLHVYNVKNDNVTGFELS